VHAPPPLLPLVFLPPSHAASEAAAPAAGQRRAGGGAATGSAADGHEGGGDAADDGDGDGDAAGGGGQPSSRGVRGLRAGGYRAAVGADAVILVENLFDGVVELVTGGSGSAVSIIQTYNGPPTKKVVVAGKLITAAALELVAAVDWRLVKVMPQHKTPVFLMNADNIDGAYGGHQTNAINLLARVPTDRLLSIGELPEFVVRSLLREKELIAATFAMLDDDAELIAANASSATADDAMTAFDNAVNAVPAYERPPLPLEGTKMIDWVNENAAATLAAMPTRDVIDAAAAARAALDALRSHIPHASGPTIAQMGAAKAVKQNAHNARRPVRPRRRKAAEADAHGAGAGAGAGGGGGDESADGDSDAAATGSIGGARKRQRLG
jgi:hypothetical protein